MVRALFLCVIVAFGVCLSTRGVLGQSGESAQEKPGGKGYHEETKWEINDLNYPYGPPNAQLYPENANEYAESAGEINEIGDERYEALVSGNESKLSGEINTEKVEYNEEVREIKIECRSELSTKH